MDSSEKRNGTFLILVLSIISVSTAAILIRFALDKATPLVIAAYRLSFSALLSVIFLLVNKKRLPLKINSSKLVLLMLSGVFLAIHFVAWIASLQLISVSSSVVLVTTTPLWVAIVSPILLKEKVKPTFFVGMIFAFAGGIIIALGNGCEIIDGLFYCDRGTSDLFSGNALGYALALLGALTAAGYMIIGRKLRPEMQNSYYTAIVYSIAAVILDLAVIFRGGNLFDYSSTVFLIFLAMAVFPQILGHSLLNFSLKSLPANVVSMALLGEPIGATILAILILKEPPTLFEIVGGVLILCGITISVINPRRVNAV